MAISPDYYAIKHQSLIDLGSGWTLLEDMSQVPARPSGHGFPAGAVDKLRRDKIALARAVYGPAVHTQADQNRVS